MYGIRRSGAERLHAWLVTGPAGHLWSGLADAVIISIRYGPWRREKQEAAAPRR